MKWIIYGCDCGQYFALPANNSTDAPACPNCGGESGVDATGEKLEAQTLPDLDGD
jgi:hypothetical protein